VPLVVPVEVAIVGEVEVEVKVEIEVVGEVAVMVHAERELGHRHRCPAVDRSMSMRVPGIARLAARPKRSRSGALTSRASRQPRVRRSCNTAFTVSL